MSLFGPPDVKKLKEKGDVKGLIKAIGYDKGDGRVSSEAADALSEINNPWMMELLINALNDSNPRVRESVASSLGNMRNSRAVEPLIVALNDSDSKVCASAAKSLGKLGDLKAVDPLIVTLQSSTSKNVRSNAAEALGKLKNPKSIESLTVTLKDLNLNVRRSAYMALIKMGWVPGNDEITVYAYGIAWIPQERDNEFVIGANEVEALISSIRSNEGWYRRDAAEKLSKITDLNAVEQLIGALEDSDILVCRSAADALGNIKDPRVVEPLIEALL